MPKLVKLYESLCFIKIRLRKKFIKVGIAPGVVVLIGIAFAARLFNRLKLLSQAPLSLRAGNSAIPYRLQGAHQTHLFNSGDSSRWHHTGCSATEGFVVKKGDKLFTIKTTSLIKFSYVPRSR